MRLLFLGSGSAFTVGDDNFQSNLLLISETGQKLLLDCGSDIRFSLHAADFCYRDITDIYISHLHADHVGGLEYMGFSALFDPDCEKYNLYLSKDLAGELWERTLSGGMRCLDGDIASLETFFTVYPIKPKGHFIWEGVQFNLTPVIHINTGFFVMPSYGLFFELSGVKIFLSTDTQLCLEMAEPYYEQADVIFHDCETSQFPSPVHAHYHQLVTLPIAIKQKMWLYGYQPGFLPDAKQDGFCGFVKCGQTFEFL